MKYRKRPVVVEAIQYEKQGPAGMKMIIDWGSSFPLHPTYITSHGRLVVHTLEGNMEAQVGDWIIRGTQGEFYPCKPDIFVETYEAVDDE
jgi:hypothetical protein